MMVIIENVKGLVQDIKCLSETPDLQDNQVWNDAGAKLVIAIDRLVNNPEAVNSLFPKDYSHDRLCLLGAMFEVLERLENINKPFKNSLWKDRFTIFSDLADLKHDDNDEGIISFYELALSRCCSLICQLLGDKIPYIQKVLLKNLFDKSILRSIFASDIYAFIMRIVNPTHTMAMCLLLMNMCKIAPPEAFVKGAALINRLKHPVINFENHNYNHLLDF